MVGNKQGGCKYYIVCGSHLAAAALVSSRFGGSCALYISWLSDVQVMSCSTPMRFGIPSAGMVGKQGVAAPVSSRLVCQPCFMCQLLHHCVNDSLLLYQLLCASLGKRQWASYHALRTIGANKLHALIR
jgi:hypothetical protein